MFLVGVVSTFKGRLEEYIADSTAKQSCPVCDEYSYHDFEISDTGYALWECECGHKWDKVSQWWESDSD